jgi:hypothetical protein
MGFQNNFGHRERIGFARLSGPAIGPYTTNFVNTVVGRGGIVTNAEKVYLTTFEGSLGFDVTEFDRLWIHGLSDNIAARTSFVNPTSTIITAVNAPNFTPNVGYLSNGTTSYLNTNFNPFNQGIKYTLNKASIGIYSRTDRNVTELEIGNVGVAGTQTILDIRDGNTFFSGVNELTNIFSANTNSRGLFSGNRLSSTSVNNYKNGILQASGANAVFTVPDLNIYLLCINVNGVATLLSRRQISVSWAGGSNFNQLNFYNAIQTLGTSIGWAV